MSQNDGCREATKQQFQEQCNRRIKYPSQLTPYRHVQPVRARLSERQTGRAAAGEVGRDSPARVQGVVHTPQQVGLDRWGN